MDFISYKVNTKQMNLQQEMAHKKFINCTKTMEFGYLATFYTTQNNSGKNQKRKIIAPKVEELN